MKDLDFDELDKAVNSLIASTPGGAGSSIASPSTPPPSSSLPSSQPSSADLSPMQATVNSLPTIPVSTTATPVDRPSTGRFMDVVHPSSDMRTSLVMPERSQSLKAATPAPKPILDMVRPTVGVTNNNETINMVADKDEDDDINQLGNDIAKSLGQVSNDSPDSPFLSDTKVEKRPLGAFSNDLSTTSANQPMIPEVAQPPMVQPTVSSVPAEVHNNDTPLPAELQSDLLSLESEVMAQPEKPAANSFPVVEKPQPNMPVPASPTPVTTPNPTTTTTTTTTTTPVNTSIPQQYKEQTNTGDQNSGAIYDTKAYHKPMAKPAKKKSGWMWVLWIVILLIAGAGAGAAIYFFVLPH